MERDRTLSGAESTSREGDAKDINFNTSDHGSQEDSEEQSDSESERATSVPRKRFRRANESGNRRKKESHISYSDLSYLNSLLRQERQIIERKIIKGCKLGECKSVVQQN